MRILFFGNCQTEAVKDILNLDSTFQQTQILVYSTELSMEQIDKIIKEADVIITQPIIDNFRDKTYLSANFLLSRKREDTKVIMFDSIFFDMYHFDIVKIDDSTVNEHYKGLIDCYNKHLTKNFYINNYVNNYNLKTKAELEKIANNAILRLEDRFRHALIKYPKVYSFISTSEYIRKNYKNKLLMYSWLHPSKFVLQHVATQIVRILNIKTTLNYNIDPLASSRHIIYKCVQNAVNFNIEGYQPAVMGAIGVENIVDRYYKLYNRS
jgi:hypothetical protein